MTARQPPSEWPLTPGEALAKLFLDNADRDANAANDELVEALRQRATAIQALAELHPYGQAGTTPRPETSAQE